MPGPPKGSPRRGGRARGTPNKTTLITRSKLSELVLDGHDPMTFFSGVMRDPAAPYDERKYAAAQLLPFYHPKLASIEARTGGLTHEDRLAQLKAMQAEAVSEEEGGG